MRSRRKKKETKIPYKVFCSINMNERIERNLSEKKNNFRERRKKKENERKYGETKRQIKYANNVVNCTVEIIFEHVNFPFTVN